MLCIGISSAVKTADTLCVIIGIVLGTVLGKLLNIEGRLDGAGKFLRRKLIRGDSNNRFTEGFVTASVLYCVGAMSITGAMEAGLNRNDSILVSKGVIDGVTKTKIKAGNMLPAIFLPVMYVPLVEWISGLINGLS